MQLPQVLLELERRDPQRFQMLPVQAPSLELHLGMHGHSLLPNAKLIAIRSCLK